MERDDFDEAAPGEIVPTTTSKGTYSAFRPDPLPSTVNTEQLITLLAEATQALGRLHGIGPRVGSREILLWCSCWLDYEAPSRNRSIGTSEMSS